MPARYWVPLPDLRAPAAVEHLHAAVSSWFDGERVPDGAASPHHDVVKPYTISPTTSHRGQLGIQVSTLTDEADEAVARNAGRARLRLGGVVTSVGRAHRIRSSSWQELAQPDNARRWTMEFETPFTYRSRNRTSPFPLPPVILRGPAVAWETYSEQRAVTVPPEHHHTIWVSDLDARTETVTLKGRTHPGLLGRVTYRCDDDTIAPAVSTLMRLAEFTGVGSFRGKGMGIVTVRPR